MYLMYNCLSVYFVFLIIRRPPRSTRTDTLFPYTTLFRSWVLALSFKANAALMADTNSVFSLPYTLANYRTLFGDGQVFRWIMNSLIVSLGMTAGVLILSSLAGYGFARLEFPGRSVVFVIEIGRAHV